MADQRPFRFRLPWLSAASAPAPRPTAGPQPPRPTVQIQAPAQPTTAIPIQRPPLRPPGTAPAQPPTTQAQAQRTEVQPASPRRETPESQLTLQQVSPSRAAIQTQVSSVPSSPSQQTRAASVPPSPSRATTQTQSPSRAAPQSRAASVPPSPSRTTAQPKPAAQTVPPPQSPSRLVSPVPEKTSSQPSSPSTTATQVQPTASQPPSPSKKLQLATEEASHPPPISTRPQTSATPQEETKQAVSSVRAIETLEASQKSDSKTIGVDHPVPPPEPEKKVMETEERKKVAEELKEEEKTNGPGTQAKELLGAAFHVEQRQKKEDFFERKKTMTRGSNGETFKTLRGRYAFGESHQKPSVFNGEKVPLHKEIREDISKFIHNNLGMEHIRHPISEKPVSIVTLAGENRGATMHVGSELVRKDGSVHIHRGYKDNPGESTEATTDGEGSSKRRRSDNVLTKEDTATKAYINSNTQSVNNSILFESSVNERSPGVQLSLSYNQAEPDKSSTKPGMIETHRAEFKVTPAEKLTYEPTVRRRCLRGLFLESSDSDPENPEKPRRHGCRYNWGSCCMTTLLQIDRLATYRPCRPQLLHEINASRNDKKGKSKVLPLAIIYTAKIFRED